MEPSDEPGRAARTAAAGPGPFEPLRDRVFRALVLASIASNVGTWVQSVGEKWLMAALTPSPLLMSLIETGTSLPLLVLALPAGALADIVDRRRLLIVAQTYMMVVAGLLSALTFAHLVTPGLLLTMSVLIGVGAALSGPAWQAIISDILPRPLVPAGVALNSAGFNVSRAVGPALGGLVVATLGPRVAFFLNAVSFLATVLVLQAWKRTVTPSDLPAERFLVAMRVGVRYVRHSSELRVILVRSVGFVFCGGIVFSLLPTLAIHRLGLGSSEFGVLLGCFGAGALGATFIVPRLRERLSPNRLLAAFTVVFAAGLLVLAFVKSAVVVGATLVVCGAAWLAVLSAYNTAVQLSVPSWVRARAFGAYIATWGGGLAIGAAVWGVVAEHAGLPATFAAASAAMLLALALTRKMRIAALYQDLDLTPIRPAPHPPEPIALERGPILVQLEYTIAKPDIPAFREAMRAIRSVRIRDGAVGWSLFEEPAPPENPSRAFVETFLSSSWGEHLRQHHRATVEDRGVFTAAYRFTPGERPRIRHLVAAWDEGDTGGLGGRADV